MGEAGAWVEADGAGLESGAEGRVRRAGAELPSSAGSAEVSRSKSATATVSTAVPG